MLRRERKDTEVAGETGEAITFQTVLRSRDSTGWTAEGLLEALIVILKGFGTHPMGIGGKAKLTTVRGQEYLDLYIHSPTSLHSTGTTLSLVFYSGLTRLDSGS
jgi:hypothetical protein